MMLYYKLLNNEGFFALRHNMIFRAMEIAKRLDSELRNDGASQFYYLASGLLGDVYSASHDRIKAEQYFTQALIAVSRWNGCSRLSVSLPRRVIRNISPSRWL